MLDDLRAMKILGMDTHDAMVLTLESRDRQSRVRSRASWKTRVLVKLFNHL